MSTVANLMYSPDSINNSCSCLFIEDYILKGLCERYDGFMVASSIDLRAYYMPNSENKLVSVGNLSEEDRARVTAMEQPVIRNLTLAASPTGAIMTAEIKSNDGWSTDTQTIDLSICIVNKNGNLFYERQYVNIGLYSHLPHLLTAFAILVIPVRIEMAR
jgi:hypothetical protein